MLMVIATPTAEAQTFNVLHAFAGGQDGATPFAGLTIDRAGNLYGTAVQGGKAGSGTVFKISRKGSNWLFAPLYSFKGGDDGANPFARVIFGPDGSLYGTTFDGGGSGCGGGGCGTVFNLKPTPTRPHTVFDPWVETVLYRFTGVSDGAGPEYGDLVFDQAHNIYGTTLVGGANHFGTVFQLTPANGSWTESVLYDFTGGSDGGAPYAGVIFDQAGNLYGATFYGGLGLGTVFQLTPSELGWTENVLYSFQGGSDGAHPVGGLLFDQSGNLYDTTCCGGSDIGGSVFGLSPANGSWTFNLLYGFAGRNGTGSNAGLIMDSAGNLYGTAAQGGANGYGAVFKLTLSSGGWTYTSLHDFTGGNDGANPQGSLLFDANGNLYGTASGGGANGDGVIFQITP